MFIWNGVKPALHILVVAVVGTQAQVNKNPDMNHMLTSEPFFLCKWTC